MAPPTTKPVNGERVRMIRPARDAATGLVSARSPDHWTIRAWSATIRHPSDDTQAAGVPESRPRGSRMRRWPWSVPAPLLPGAIGAS